MDNETIRNYFARASGLDESNQGCLTDIKWANKRRISGAKVFKNKVFGPFKWKVQKEDSELAQILKETNIISSSSEAKELLSNLDGESITYKDSLLSLFGGEIGFRRISDHRGNDRYEIYVYAFN